MRTRNFPEAACGGCRDSEAIFPFTMAFQPVVDIQARRIVSYEALVRGIHGEGAGHVLGQINAGNRYAFDQACRTRAIELASRLGMDVALSINFLPNAVYQPETCIQTTLRAARRTGFPLNRITFEVIEHEDLVDPSHLRRIVAAYKEFGFKIALDDFGTAYSGLCRLADLKPDIVKIDRALICNCARDSWRLAIVTSLVGLCRELDIRIVAEGMETTAEVQALAQAGVRFMQGFYFARPAFEALVREETIPWPDQPADQIEPANHRTRQPQAALTE